MNKRNHIAGYRLLCLAMLLTASAGSVVGQNGFELYGARSEQGVRLYWECLSWPSDLHGFIIKRAEAGTNQWETLSKQPLLPEIDRETDYTSRGVSNPEMQSALKAELEKMLNQERITLYSETELRSVLTEHNGLAPGDRIRLKDNYYLALIMGFAFVDETADNDKLYSYALHGYLSSGSTSEEAFDIFEMKEISTANIGVQFSPASNNIELTWAFSEKDFEALSLLGFTISRRSPSETNIEEIVTSPLAGISKNEDMVEFRFVDRSADPDSDYIYYLYPANMFQQKGEPTVVYYTAEMYQTPMPPQIKMISLSGDKDMAVFWAVAPEDSMIINRFVLEITTEPGDTSSLVSADTMDGSYRWYLDKRAKGYGTMYYYQVRAFTRYGRNSVSAPVASYYLGQIAPPPVRGLKADLILEEEDTYVHMKWDKPDKGDTVTKGFFIYSDELIPDSFLRISDLPMITENEYLYKITSQGGRDYKFRIAGVSESGKTGDPGQIDMSVGTLSMPEVYHIYPRVLKTGNVLIKWNYPDIKDLAGFRLQINGKEIAGPDVITGDMRSYLYDLPKRLPSEGIRINIIAVGSLSESDEGVQSRLYLPNHRTPEIPPPGLISYEIITGNDTAVQLCWDPPAGYSENIEGYVFFMDYSIPGMIQRINSIPVIRGNSFLLTSNLKGRESVTIGIAAMNSDGTTGRINEMVIDLKKEK